MNNHSNCQEIENVERFLAELEAMDGTRPMPALPVPQQPVHRSLVERMRERQLASNPARQDQALSATGRASPVARTTRCPVRHPHTPSHPRKTPSSTSHRLTLKASPFKRSITAVAHHDGYTFTLNLSEKREAKINEAIDPARAMSQHMRRAFDALALGLPDLAFTVEVSRHGRTHLHGVLLSDADPSILKKALMKAGGKIAGRAASRQVDLKPFDWQRGGPDGWATYLSKATLHTRRTLEIERLTYISNGLRRLARATL